MEFTTKLGIGLMQYSAAGLLAGLAAMFMGGEFPLSSAITAGMVLVLVYRFGRHLISSKDIQMESPSEEFFPLILLVIVHSAGLKMLIAPVAAVLLLAGIIIYYTNS